MILASRTSEGDAVGGAWVTARREFAIVVGNGGGSFLRGVSLFSLGEGVVEVVVVAAGS